MRLKIRYNEKSEKFHLLKTKHGLPSPAGALPAAAAGRLLLLVPAHRLLGIARSWALPAAGHCQELDPLKNLKFFEIFLLYQIFIYQIFTNCKV